MTTRLPYTLLIEGDPFEVRLFTEEEAAEENTKADAATDGNAHWEPYKPEHKLMDAFIPSLRARRDSMLASSATFPIGADDPDLDELCAELFELQALLNEVDDEPE